MTWEPTQPLSHSLAAQARDVVVAYFHAYCHDETGQRLPDDALPCLFEPGHNGDGWDLVWESGPHDWTILVSTGGRDELGAWYPPATFGGDVFAEPINGCELGLYPA